MGRPAFLEHAQTWEPLARRLAAELRLGWSWDALYYTVSAKAPIDDLDQVARVLRGALGSEWNAETFRGAPAPVRDLGAWTGGLEGEQRLFHAPIGVTTLFATLWPWAIGGAATVRLGCWQPNDRIDDRAPLGELVRAWFGL